MNQSCRFNNNNIQECPGYDTNDYAQLDDVDQDTNISLVDYPDTESPYIISDLRHNIISRKNQIYNTNEKAVSEEIQNRLNRLQGKSTKKPKMVEQKPKVVIEQKQRPRPKVVIEPKPKVVTEQRLKPIVKQPRNQNQDQDQESLDQDFEGSDIIELPKHQDSETCPIQCLRKQIVNTYPERINRTSILVDFWQKNKFLIVLFGIVVFLILIFMIYLMVTKSKRTISKSDLEKVIDLKTPIFSESSTPEILK